MSRGCRLVIKMVQKSGRESENSVEKCLNSLRQSRNILAVRKGQWTTVEGDAEMRKSTYYVQECPTCGRTLEIRVEYLGREVVCQHCRGHFIATDPATLRVPDGEQSAIMRRADELLAQASRKLGMTG